MTTATQLLPALERKAWATLQARLALAQFKADVIEGDNGRPLFVVSRWTLTRAFDSLDAVAAFADRVGAPA